MPVPQTPWADLIAHLAAREHELELVASDPESESLNPYWDHDDARYLLLEISQRLIREMPRQELETLGSVAVVAQTAGTTFTLPLACVNILSALVQVDAAVSRWYPAQYVSPQAWFQTYTADPATTFTRFTIIGGQVLFKGNSIAMIWLEEPPLASFEADLPILPPVAYDETRIDWVHKMFQVEDFMPGGRV